jgi:hypothetical protein
MQTKMVQSEGPISQGLKNKKLSHAKKKWKYEEEMSFLLDYP